jgi:alpha-L-fucosidase 2
MQRLSFILFLLITQVSIAQVSTDDPNLKLWYKTPATIWEEALPLGNAKTGAMVFGGIARERFQLYDNTLWSGYPNPGNNPDASKYFGSKRTCIRVTMIALPQYEKHARPYSARYLPLADLWIQNQLSDTTSSSTIVILISITQLQL